MQICTRPVTIGELRQMEENFFGDMVKGVVDIKLQKLALDAELHSDLEALLLDAGSEQNALWGINLYPESQEGFLEFDSLINIRPSLGNRSRGVEDPAIQKQIAEVVDQWILR